jgi:hypothetical protein
MGSAHDDKLWYEQLHHRTYAHMCRDDHIQIGHNDSSCELCPLCRANNEIERLQAKIDVERWRPIDTLDVARGTVLVWNGCDGVHVFSMLFDGPADRIRNLSDGFTHWMPEPCEPKAEGRS